MLLVFAHYLLLFSCSTNTIFSSAEQLCFKTSGVDMNNSSSAVLPSLRSYNEEELRTYLAQVDETRNLVILELQSRTQHEDLLTISYGIRASGELPKGKLKCVRKAKESLDTCNRHCSTRRYRDFLNSVINACGRSAALLVIVARGKEKMSRMAAKARTDLVEHLKASQEQYYSPDLLKLAKEYGLPIGPSES